MNVAILGRGESLYDINKLKNFPIDICILCNTFTTELRHKDIWNFVKDKKIIHLMSKVKGSPLTKEMYQKLGVSYCIINRPEKDWIDHPNKKVIEDYDINMKLIPEPLSIIENGHGISEYAKTIPSTGFVGLAYAVFELKAENVYIIGMDFYETQFMSTGRIWHRTKLKNLREKQMKDWLLKLAEKTQDVTYTIITRSNHRHDIPNIRYL